jgi:hypothetical protein
MAKPSAAASLEALKNASDAAGDAEPTWDEPSSIRFEVSGDMVSYEMGLPGYDGWGIAGTFMDDDGQLVLVDLRVFPLRRAWPSVTPSREAPVGEWDRRKDQVPASRTITTRMVRDVRVGRFTELAALVLEEMAKMESTINVSAHAPVRLLSGVNDPMGRRRAGHPLPVRRFADLAARQIDTGRGRGPRRDDRFYALWAANYAITVDTKSRRPIADLATQTGADPAWISDVIHSARERGLLSKAHQGRPGGKLTAKGWAAYEQAVDAGLELAQS